MSACFSPTRLGFEPRLKLYACAKLGGRIHVSTGVVDLYSLNKINLDSATIKHHILPVKLDRAVGNHLTGEHDRRPDHRCPKIC